MADKDLINNVKRLKLRREAVEEIVQDKTVDTPATDSSPTLQHSTPALRRKRTQHSGQSQSPYPRPSMLAAVRQTRSASYQEAANLIQRNQAVEPQQELRKPEKASKTDISSSTNGPANTSNASSQGALLPVPNVPFVGPSTTSERPNALSPIRTLARCTPQPNKTIPVIPAGSPTQLHRTRKRKRNSHTGRLTSTHLCSRYSSTGSCLNGLNCLGLHDDNKLALCPAVLHNVRCLLGQACDLSHVPSPERSPICRFFQIGRCDRGNCVYAHTLVDPDAPLCDDFAYAGYCDRGAQCRYRHLRQCPEFASTRGCNNTGCRLPHVVRSSQRVRRRLDGSAMSSGSMTLEGSPVKNKLKYGPDSSAPAPGSVEEPMEGPRDFTQEQDFIGL
ncbi:hypothetical protein ABEF95_006603 [Exophiala dermatitidis]